MPSRLQRFHNTGHYHAINFSCYRHQPWLHDEHACIVFEKTLEELRKRHEFYLFGGWPNHKSGWPIHARRFISAWAGGPHLTSDLG